MLLMNILEFTSDMFLIFYTSDCKLIQFGLSEELLLVGLTLKIKGVMQRREKIGKQENKVGEER